MDLSNMKIQDLDKERYGLVSASDLLDGDSKENKLRFDLLPNFIADKHNDLLNHVESNVYTKGDVDLAISEKINEIGAGDMAKNIYDKDNSGTVDIADNGIFSYQQIGNELVGSGKKGYFKASKSGMFTSFIIKDKSYNIKSSAGSDIELVEGNLYEFTLDELEGDIFFTNYSNAKITYSQQEIKTNKLWIDGKEIYQRVIVFECASTTNEIPFEFASSVVMMQGMIIKESLARIVPIYFHNSGGVTLELDKFNNNIRLEFRDINTDGYVAQVIIEYTK